jgi:hypothetical protein
MKAVEFAYWLQGYFEINGGAEALTTVQARQVLHRAGTVTAGRDEVEIKAASFIAYTQGILFPVTQAVPPSQEFLKMATVDLKNKLSDLFIHAIDSSYAGDQAQFGAAHKPDFPNYGDGMRC